MSWSFAEINLLALRPVYYFCRAGLRKNAFVSKTVKEHSQRLNKSFDQPQNTKIVTVSIIGAPNSGKSTLMNRILGMSVSASSPKAHTTRKNVIGVYTEDSSQVVFYDSPGLVTAVHCVRHRLEPTFRTDPKSSANASDIILAIVDCSNPREKSKLNPGIIELLQSFENKPSILVLNKVDIVASKQTLLDITNTLTNGFVDGVPVSSEPAAINVKMEERAREKKLLDRMVAKGYIVDVSLPHKDEENLAIGWGKFSRVFMISALTGDGVKELLTYLVSQAKPGEWQYDYDLPTPRNPLSIASDIIREQVLTHMGSEVPYRVNIVIQNWSHDERTGTLAIYAELIAPTRSDVSALLGVKGAIISKISMTARQELCNTFQCDVMLKIAVKHVKQGK